MAFDAVDTKAKPRPSIAAVTKIRKYAITSPVVIGDTLSPNSQLRHAFVRSQPPKYFFRKRSIRPVSQASITCFSPSGPAKSQRSRRRAADVGSAPGKGGAIFDATGRRGLGA